MPKETFNDVAGNDNTLVVKWGVWGTVEIATESKGEFPYPFALISDDPETVEKMRGWYLSLSREELTRLIKVLTRASRQYDSTEEREVAPEPVLDLPIAEKHGELPEPEKETPTDG